MKKIITLLVLGILPLLLLVGCSDEPKGTVVARVNGYEIAMAELQARYDLDHLTWSDSKLPQAEELQRQYGDSLASLIINTLVMQALDEKKLAVTDEELSLAELEMRKDYAGGEFEKTLEEDAIDINMWRHFLRQRLSVQKFTQTVLRPEIRVSLEESTAYYNANIDKFSLPPRVHFLVVESQNKSSLENSLEEYKKNRKAEKITESTDIRVREVRMRKDRLSPQWERDLKELKEGDASMIKPDEAGYQFIILIEHQPQTVLELTQAYPLVEKELVEQKLEAAFDLWVNQEISRADIEISAPLAEVWITKNLAPAKEHRGSVEMPFDNRTTVFENYNSNSTSISSSGESNSSSEPVSPVLNEERVKLSNGTALP